MTTAAHYEACLLRRRRLEERLKKESQQAVSPADVGETDQQQPQPHPRSSDQAAALALCQRAEEEAVLTSALASCTTDDSDPSASPDVGANGSIGAAGSASREHLEAFLQCTAWRSSVAAAASDAAGQPLQGRTARDIEASSLVDLAVRSNAAHPLRFSEAAASDMAKTNVMTADDFFAAYPECAVEHGSGSSLWEESDDDDDESSCEGDTGGTNGKGSTGNGAAVPAHVAVPQSKPPPAAAVQPQPSEQPQYPQQPTRNPYGYGANNVPRQPRSNDGVAAGRGWNEFAAPSAAANSGYGYGTHNNSAGSSSSGRTPPSQQQQQQQQQPAASAVGEFRTARELSGGGGSNGGAFSYGDEDDHGNKANAYGNRGGQYGRSNNISGHGGAVGTAGRSNSNEGNNNSRPSSLLPSNHHQQISAGLKRKFQPPTRRNAGANGGNANGGGSGIGKNTSMISRKVCGGGTGGSGGGVSARPSGRSNNNNNEDEEELPEELQGLDKELVSKIMNEIVDSGESVTFDDIAGLADAKQTVLELVCWPMKRPDLFTGLRRGPNGLLLYGPPGTGKTLVGKAIAHESGATFFSISSSSLTSKWIGEGEKLVRTLFAVAAYKEPAVVFIDEIDSLLTARKADENEASRRIKTEFLVQLDGTGTSGQGRLLCIGATNRPHELDDAARRRFVKRLYIPLPEQSDREVLLRTLLKKNAHCLSDKEIAKLSSATAGYSGADLKALCNDASMGPIRDLGPNAMEVASSDVPPISYKHFRRSLKGMNPSVSKEDLDDYIKFNETYGTGHKKTDDDDDDSSDDSD